MLEKVSAALNTTPTTIPQTPHISKNPQKKKKEDCLLDIIILVSQSWILQNYKKNIAQSVLNFISGTPINTPT